MSAAAKPRGVPHPELIKAHRNLELVAEGEKLPALEGESLRIAPHIRTGAISEADCAAGLRNAAKKVGLYESHRRDDVEHVINMGLKGIPSGVGCKSKTTVEAKPEPPRPLMRDLPPADPFPVDALGGVLALAARAIHDRVQAPLAMCGQSVLAVATLAVQGHTDIELPTGQRRPLTNYYLTIAATGERKTAVDTEALSPVRRRESALQEKAQRGSARV